MSATEHKSLQQDGQDAAHGYVDDVDCIIVKLHTGGNKMIRDS